MTLSNPAQYISGRTVQEQMNSLIDYVDTRSAEVATDAIAADVAQVHQDMLDADADAAAAAASAAAAAGTLANAVKKTGESAQAIQGDISLTGGLSIGTTLAVTGLAALTGGAIVPAPTQNTDPATKKYVDDQDALKISITDINTYAVGLTGNQNIAGVKNFTTPIDGGYVTSEGNAPGSTDEYVRIARFGQYSQTDIMIYANTPNNGLGIARILMGGSDGFDRSYTIYKKGVFASADFVRVSSGGRNELWIKKPANLNQTQVILVHTTTSSIDTNVIAATGLSALPTVGAQNPITGETIAGVSVIS